MRQLLRILGGSLVLLSLATVGSAQTCLGRGDFGARAVQLDVGANFASGARGIEAGLAGGSNGFFSGSSVSFNKFDSSDNTQVVIAGDLGGQVTGGAQRRVAFCPLGAFEYIFGPNQPAVSTRAFDLQLGGAVGVVAGQTSSFSVVPTFGMFYVRTWPTIEQGGASVRFPSTREGIAAIGVGVRFNNHRSAVVPSLTIPFGADTAHETTFSVALTTNF